MKLTNCINCKWRRNENKCGNPKRDNKEIFKIPYIAYNGRRYDCPKRKAKEAIQ